MHGKWPSGAARHLSFPRGTFAEMHQISILSDEAVGARRYRCKAGGEARHDRGHLQHIRMRIDGLR